ncbi:hypothetical protein [Chondromyces apiculatus]|uniref:Uncharacterized protein n=1 Tax=Chondromyces apiculatus DSM 436 TaxID=1192034 RepID=A0A017TEN2_9BACT|nr:hypothetical protein [Chondromyces apiculatus]EYF07699.1 Hypothetical protein CAP_8200 [Chondromyces apiculatus DSM 436]
MREIHRSDYSFITVDDARGLIRRVRTSVPFPSIAELRTSSEASLQALATLDRTRYAQLADVRLAPPRNDPAFEEYVAAYARPLFTGFRRSALLVRTHAGRLQVTRNLGDTGLHEVQVYMDEALAVGWLLSHSTLPRPLR